MSLHRYSRVWWRSRRFLLFPAVNYLASAVLAIASAAVAVAALALSRLSVVGWALTAVCCTAAATYLVDILARRRVLRNSPTVEKQITPDNFLLAPHAPTAEYRFVRPADSTDREIYPYVDLCHHSPHIRAENDLTRAERVSVHGRWRSLCPRGFLHLEKKVQGEWRPIAVSELFPISVEGFHAFTRPERALQQRTIDLGAGEVRDSLDRRQRALLLNLWVVDRAYKGPGHGRRGDLGGQAHALVLRHIAEFWPARRHPPVVFLVETSNRYLVAALMSLGFRPAGVSKVGVDLYRLDTNVLGSVMPNEYRKLREAIGALEKVPVTVGTVGRPRDWRSRFPAG